MVRYEKKEIRKIIEAVENRGDRLTAGGRDPLDNILHALLRIAKWLGQRDSLSLSDLKELEPGDFPSSSRTPFLKQEAYRSEFNTFRDVLLSIDLLDIPSLVSDADIREYVVVRLELSK
jgi:hypothetical protein